MSKPETEMYQELRIAIGNKALAMKLERHIVRIESNLTNQGIPDIYCIINSKSFWIECKINDMMLAPLQVSFREQEHQAGGHVFGVMKKINAAMSFKEEWSLFYRDNYVKGDLKDIVQCIFDWREIV